MEFDKIKQELYPYLCKYFGVEHAHYIESKLEEIDINIFKTWQGVGMAKFKYDEKYKFINFSKKKLSNEYKVFDEIDKRELEKQVDEEYGFYLFNEGLDIKAKQIVNIVGEDFKMAIHELMHALTTSVDIEYNSVVVTTGVATVKYASKLNKLKKVESNNKVLNEALNKRMVEEFISILPDPLKEKYGSIEEISEYEKFFSGIIGGGLMKIIGDEKLRFLMLDSQVDEIRHIIGRKAFDQFSKFADEISKNITPSQKEYANYVERFKMLRIESLKTILDMDKKRKI